MKRLLLAALCCGVCVSCATKHGRCYPVIGLGFVIVDKNPDVTVVKTTLVGAGVNTLPASAMVGYSQTSWATVATNSNVVIELK